MNRNIAVDEPRVTTFPIVWDEQQSTDQLVFAELTEEEKKMAEMNEELEICHSLENVNCTNETPSEPQQTNESEPSTEATPAPTTTTTTTAVEEETTTTNEMEPSVELSTVNESVVPTETSTAMDATN